MYLLRDDFCRCRSVVQVSDGQCAQVESGESFRASVKGVVVSAVDRRVETSKLQYNCKTWRIERTRV